ncbi:CBS domain-containing protein [Parapedobacter indicus]|uniref:CBS domain-containing protein n=1 Tax=Parapedobacter indicus TaxID=1477437 RepID=A0A1I3CYY4_9SPHI|nr:CBS domain-containing protein [Parapedobacter indicus]PPL04456.1 CBS domain protein [Parapedobacter indicus]SFH79657.1 CBS domain-containing protein [Parapedobacter indicus]
MNIHQVITDSNYAINPTDSIRYTLDKMADLRLTQLPVVKNGAFLGSVSYETLAGLANTDQRIDRADIVYQQIYIYSTQHIFDALLFFQIYQLDLLVVVDEHHTYLGAITPLELINTLSQTMSIHQPGGIIVLEMGQRDNALSHIAHIVESDNAQILNSYVQTFSDSSRLEVTIKINKSNISSIVSSFLRHDYTVKATYNDESSRDNSRDRYEQLMNYINM